jgi:hypothetical protein
LATSRSDKPWVDIASRLIGLVTALVLVYFFALIGNHALTKTISPAEFVRTHEDEAQRVADGVEAVERIKATLLQKDKDVAAKTSVQSTLSDQKDSFGAVRDSLVSSASNPPAGYESDYAEMVTTVGQLSDAVTTFGSFIDAKTPSDLATLRKQWTTQWECGRDQWDKAVKDIWNAAHRPPPTVHDTSAAECRSPGVR